MKSKVLVLIPVRGGSKGFPGKNVALLAGIPLVGRSARAARGAANASAGDWRVVCSTDDPVIAEAARAWGAEVPFTRPAALATDEARSLDVVRHAVEALEQDFEAVVMLQATSPLTEPDDILGALDLHRRTGDPVVSVCQAHHPVEWHFRMDDDRRLVPLASAEMVHQRQQAPAAYRPNGAVYVASPAQARNAGFWTSETRGFVMPAERSVDIDTPEDLAVARARLESRPVSCIEIAGRRIGPGEPCFIIAEAGVNHNGSVDLALKLVDAAAASGADAVKFQTFRADRLATQDAPKADYQVRTTGAAESQYDMLKKLELDEEAHRMLMARCEEKGILFLSTPYDEESCDLLESLDLPAFKVPSGELTNLPFLCHVARKGRPIILSTGMATMVETAAAVDCIRDAGCRELALLHCVSNYPADPADANLRAIATLRNAFAVPSGFSDHTQGDAVALGAAALGACILEKHFTLDRTMPGPDHQASIEPPELAQLVQRVQTVQNSLGSELKNPAQCELQTSRLARKSLVAIRTIKRGTQIMSMDIRAKRPANGIPPAFKDDVVGKKATREIRKGESLSWDMIE